MKKIFKKSTSFISKAYEIFMNHCDEKTYSEGKLGLFCSQTVPFHKYIEKYNSYLLSLSNFSKVKEVHIFPYMYITRPFAHKFDLTCPRLRSIS